MIYGTKRAGNCSACDGTGKEVTERTLREFLMGCRGSTNDAVVLDAAKEFDRLLGEVPSNVFDLVSDLFKLYSKHRSGSEEAVQIVDDIEAIVKGRA